MTDALVSQTPKARVAELTAILNLIADGYFLEVKDGRFIILGNPYYEPDNGQDPKIVFDVSRD